MTKHVFEVHEDCYIQHCSVCDGGLAICTVCGLIEGSLTTDCPGEDCWLARGDAIYAGKIDFREGAWVALPSPHAP